MLLSRGEKTTASASFLSVDSRCLTEKINPLLRTRPQQNTGIHDECEGRYRVFAARVCLFANCINTTVNKSHSSLRYATTEDSRSTALHVIRREFRSSPEFLLADSHISVFSRTTGISVYLLFICLIWLVLHLTIMYG